MATLIPSTSSPRAIGPGVGAAADNRSLLSCSELTGPPSSLQPVVTGCGQYPALISRGAAIGTAGSWWESCVHHGDDCDDGDGAGASNVDVLVLMAIVMMMVLIGIGGNNGDDDGDGSSSDDGNNGGGGP